MGAPKQKWTSEEERALKAGVVKHGTGKWRTILSDPQFSSALHSRSNVDLKDKWRNISVTALYGSRKKAKLAHKKNHNQDDDNSTALTIVALTNGDDAGQQIDPPSPLAVTGEPSSSRDFQGLFASVDKILLNGIATLERPLGPDVKTIMQYVEDNPDTQPDMKRLVTSRLKHLISVGTIVKIKHRYRITPSYEATRAAQSSRQPISEGNKENSPNPEENGVPNLTKSQVDGEVAKIKGMTIQEASAVAAKAVAEAEVAKAEALEAAREAAEAEAEAEAAQLFAMAAMGALRCRT